MGSVLLGIRFVSCVPRDRLQMVETLAGTVAPEHSVVIREYAQRAPPTPVLHAVVALHSPAVLATAASPAPTEPRALPVAPEHTK